jgi:hypothetical protein
MSHGFLRIYPTFRFTRRQQPLNLNARVSKRLNASEYLGGITYTILRQFTIPLEK